MSEWACKCWAEHLSWLAKSWLCVQSVQMLLCHLAAVLLAHFGPHCLGATLIGVSWRLSVRGQPIRFREMLLVDCQRALLGRQAALLEGCLARGREREKERKSQIAPHRLSVCELGQQASVVTARATTGQQLASDVDAPPTRNSLARASCQCHSGGHLCLLARVVLLSLLAMHTTCGRPQCTPLAARARYR